MMKCAPHLHFWQLAAHCNICHLMADGHGRAAMLCPPAICYNGCYPLRKGLSQLKTVQAIVEDNQIILLEAVPLRAGQRLLITFLNDPESQFWAEASQNSLEVIWDNEEDDIYAQAIAYSIPGD